MIKDQEDAGLDILTDGQMWFDDYHMGIGSFLWYWLERTHGFSSGEAAAPGARARRKGRDVWALDEAGGVAVEGADRARPGAHGAALPAGRSATRTSRSRRASAPGPVQLSTLAHFRAGPVKNRYELSRALADVFRAEIAELVDAGCKHIQLEDLGAWMPHLSGDKDFAWVQRDRRPHDGARSRRASSARGTSAWATRGATSSRA